MSAENQALKDAIEKHNRALEEFKASNDARLKVLETGSRPDPLLVAKVDKANADITSTGEKIVALQAQVARQITELEAKLIAPGVGGDQAAAEKEIQAAVRFMSSKLGREVGRDEVDLESFRAYRKTFNTYLRKGEKGTGIQAAMEVGSDPNGGYFVEPDTGGKIIQLVFETSPMRSVASATTIGTDALEGINDLDEAGSGWVGERGTRSETDTPEVGRYRIPVHEIYAEPRATQKMLDDSNVDVEAWLGGKVANRFMRQENDAFVNGDGILKPRGFLTYSAGTPSKATWQVMERINTGESGGFDAYAPGDVFHDTIAALKSFYVGGASWAMNRSTLAAVRKLKDGDGTYLWEKSFQAAQPFQLLGHPVVMMEDMPDISYQSLSIAFGNFREGYLIVDRTGIRVLRDPFTAKPYVKFYTTKRVGGDVVNFEALKLIQFS